MEVISTHHRVSRLVLVVAAALPLLLSPLASFAQGPGGQGGPGGFQMTPEMQANMQKMRKFRDDNKHVFELGQTLRAFEDMDKDPKTKFTPAQAKTILAVVNKWKTKPAINNEQATQINKDLTKSLSMAQIKALAAAASRRGGGGGGGGRPGGGGGFGGGQGGPGGGGGRPGGGGGQGGPGGGGRPGGGGGAWKMPELKPFNPLNPDTGFSRNKEMAKRRMSEMTAMLAARAAGK